MNGSGRAPPLKSPSSFQVNASRQTDLYPTAEYVQAIRLTSVWGECLHIRVRNELYHEPSRETGNLSAKSTLR